MCACPFQQFYFNEGKQMYYGRSFLGRETPQRKTQINLRKSKFHATSIAWCQTEMVFSVLCLIIIHILLLAWKSFWETNPQLLKTDIISLKWNNLPLKCFYPKARVTVWQLRCLWSTPNYLGPCCWTFIWILLSFAYPLTILLLMPPPIASLADGMVGCGFTSSSFKRPFEGLLELEP